MLRLGEPRGNLTPPPLRESLQEGKPKTTTSTPTSTSKHVFSPRPFLSSFLSPAAASVAPRPPHPPLPPPPPANVTPSADSSGESSAEATCGNALFSLSLSRVDSLLPPLITAGLSAQVPSSLQHLQNASVPDSTFAFTQPSPTHDFARARTRRGAGNTCHHGILNLCSGPWAPVTREGSANRSWA